MAGKQGEDFDLSPNIRENFNPRKKWQDAIRIIQVSNKFKAAGAARAEPLDSDSDSDGGFKTASDDETKAKIAAAQAQPSAAAGGGLAGLVNQVNKMKV